MARIPDTARAVLEGPALAHLVTLEADGRPQVSIVWIGVDGDELIAAHLPEHRKVRNIRRDPRVALSVEAGTRNELGLDEYVVIHGSARVTEGGAPEALQQLARVYLGPDVKFPPMDEPPPGYITHITVERVGGVGPWAR
jgi:PPOX class probable F420-dependent enzyme